MSRERAYNRLMGTGIVAVAFIAACAASAGLAGPVPDTEPPPFAPGPPATPAAQPAPTLPPPVPPAPPPSLSPSPPPADPVVAAALAADAAMAGGDVASSLAHWQAYLGAAHEHERAFARVRSDEIAALVPADAALSLFRSSPDGSLARAVLGRKAAARLREKGDPAAADHAEADADRSRRALGFDETRRQPGPGDPTRFGVALPLSGRLRPLGDAALRGAMLATGVPRGLGGSSTPYQIILRDTAGDPGRARRGIGDLARREAIIGVVGTTEREASSEAAAQAREEGVPFLTLEESAPGAGTPVFALVHSDEARAAELARRAVRLGARTFGVIGPDSASGKRLGAAFARAVVAAGGKMTAEATYVAGATSFTAVVAVIRKASPDALFVPDTADRLELLAPALAVADLWPRPWDATAKHGRSSSGGRRSVLLLSTASGLSSKLVANAGRYVQGALLSPGFFPDRDGAREKEFVTSYQQTFAQDPGATEAYAYDGVRILRQAAERGARARADLMALLAGQSFSGVTGDIKFGPDHARSDPPRVYVVDGDAIRAVP